MYRQPHPVRMMDIFATTRNAQTGPSSGSADGGRQQVAEGFSDTLGAQDDADDGLTPQERLRQERLAKFGSYTAYSLWRKIPAMAAGLIEPKSEAYFEKHGLLDYWKNERDHFQGGAATTDGSENAPAQTDPTGPTADGEATALTDSPAEQTPDQAIAANQEPAPDASSKSETAAEPETAQTQRPGSQEAVSEAQQPAAAPVAAPAPAAEEPKTPEQLRAERLEKFGSYTAYSLWRKIPAMAAGIIQPKPDAYYEKHGLGGLLGKRAQPFSDPGGGHERGGAQRDEHPA